MQLQRPEPSQVKADSLSIAYLIPDQVWMTSVVTGVEIFHAVEGLHQSEIITQYLRSDIRFLAVPGMTGTGFTGFSLPLEPIDDRLFDIIVIPAAWRLTEERLSAFAKLKDWFARQHEHGAMIVGLAVSTLYLAETGLLDGRTATTHWAFVDEFRHRYPHIVLNPKQSIIESDGVISTSNYRGSMEVTLKLIRQFFGEETAQRCDRYFALTDYTIEDGFEPSAFRDHLVEALKNHVGMNLNGELSLEYLADHFNVSSKTLMRRCQHALGMTPIQYVQYVRLERAKQLLLTTDHSIERIAEQCGYASTTVFGRAFKQKFERAPSVFRRYVQGN